MQQTVRLLGDLGERYGSEHRYHDLRSPAEAIKLLCINKPEFQKELTEAHKRGIGYTLVQAGECLNYDDLHLPLGKNDLVLTPVVAGSGGGGGALTQILVGVGLVALSFVSFGAGTIFAGSVGVTGIGAVAGGLAVSQAAVGSIALLAIGGALALSGTAQLLSPQPVIPSLDNNRRTVSGENTNASGAQGVSRAVSGQQSYAFSGPANTVGVGATVPLVYGKLLVGSHLISSKVEVADESDPTSNFFIAPGAATITVNGEKPKNNFKSHNGLRTRKWSDSSAKLENKNTSKGYKKRLSSDVLAFDQVGETENTSDIRNYDQDDNEFGNLQVFLEIDKGLGRQLGGKTVPAFVTYELVVKKDNYSGESPIFCNVRGTIQGLLASTDNYKWCHAITYGVSGKEDGDTTVDVRYRIIDTDADTNNGRIKVRGVGYDHFTNSSQNQTENLVSEA
jgi:predicted phage tail protein